MPVSKQEAVRLRGGHEMKKIFTIIPYVKGAGVRRPHTVQVLDGIKYGSSKVMTKHDVFTCDKYKARERPVLQQRGVGYPVHVPDISAEATNETLGKCTYTHTHAHISIHNKHTRTYIYTNIYTHLSALEVAIPPGG